MTPKDADSSILLAKLAIVAAILYILCIALMARAEGISHDSGYSFGIVANEPNYGGPMQCVYTLTAPAETSCRWYANCDVMWVLVSPTTGTLAAGESAQIVVSITPDAAALSPGDWEAPINFEWSVLRGDMTGDGMIDMADVPMFVAMMTDGLVSTDLFRVVDMNADGSLDGRDVSEFTDLLMGE